jgi:hypothetical protein
MARETGTPAGDYEESRRGRRLAQLMRAIASISTS